MTLTTPTQSEYVSLGHEQRIRNQARVILSLGTPAPDCEERGEQRARRVAPGDELRGTRGAVKHLSEAGCEVLEMMEYAAKNSGLSIADAYVEASATTNLSERDKDIIKAYLARRTLIEAFSDEKEGQH